MWQRGSPFTLSAAHLVYTGCVADWPVLGDKANREGGATGLTAMAHLLGSPGLVRLELHKPERHQTGGSAVECVERDTQQILDAAQPVAE